MFFSSPVKSAEFLEEAPRLELTSPSLTSREILPAVHTCDGKGSSPELRWTAGPETTESFLLIMKDLDAPNGEFVHWVLYNLPSRVYMIPKGVPAIKALANSERHGTNSAGELGYDPPCPWPVSGAHRYVFKIYALNIMLELDSGASVSAIYDAMEGHILAEGTLVGLYERSEPS